MNKLCSMFFWLLKSFVFRLVLRYYSLHDHCDGVCFKHHADHVPQWYGPRERRELLLPSELMIYRAEHYVLFRVIDNFFTRILSWSGGEKVTTQSCAKALVLRHTRVYVSREVFSTRSELLGNKHQKWGSRNERPPNSICFISWIYPVLTQINV